jgi:penicillin-binding protein 2
MDPARAIAYSCNCAVAHFAQRFIPGELASYFTRTGFESPTGILPAPESPGVVRRPQSADDCELQALGETGIVVTALELLRSYASLSRRSKQAELAPILDGLEGAVNFGTAQLIHSSRLQVAAKTGSVALGSGLHAAWIAGFAPSRAPEVAFTVLVQGRAGGSDAAPIALQMLRSYFKDRL